MTGKLIKYEFRSMLRLMGILWAGLPATAAVMACFNRFFSYDGLGEYPAVLNLLDAGITFLFVALFMALIGVTILLMSIFHMRMAYPGEFFRSAGEIIAERPLLAVIMLEGILLGISWLMVVIYKIYASMSIGQLAAKHKIVCSVAAHIGISIAGVLLLSFLSDAVFHAFGGVLESVDQWLSGIGSDGSTAFALLAVILAELAQLAVYHTASVQILKRKLNLE